MGMTARRARPAGRHARVGRPQRRRDRRQRSPSTRSAHGASGSFLRDYADGKGMRVDDLKRGWGGAHAAHLKAIFAEAAKRTASASPTSRACWASASCTASINLPLKWFLGTYPVLLDIVHEAHARRRAGAGAGGQALLEAQRRRRADSSAARRRARAVSRDLQLRLAGDRRGVLLRHVRVDAAANLQLDAARPARAATSPTCSAPSAATLQETLQELRRLDGRRSRRCALEA